MTGEVLRQLVDSRYGVVSRAQLLPGHPGEPSFYYANAQACDTTAFAAHPNFSAAAGAATTPARALAKAIGEAVERYCAAVYDPSELLLRAVKDMDCPHLSPTSLALYSDEQYSSMSTPFHRFADDTQVRWCRGHQLSSGENVFVPAAMVYVPYMFSEGDNEVPIMQPISTGLACHTTWAQAAAGAICEVVERDCFMITWLNMLSPRRIRLESLDPKCLNLVERFLRVGRDIVLLDMSLDSRIPAVMAVQRNFQGAPSLVISAASAPRASDAIVKSLEELALTAHYTNAMMLSGPEQSFEYPFDSVVSQDDHLAFWCKKDAIQNATFLFEGETIDLAEMSELKASADVVGELLKNIQATGHDVILVDITTDEIRDLGIWVLRAIVPGYQPLCMGHSSRPLGGARLRKFTREENVFNLFPHPFP